MTAEERALLGLPCVRVRIKPDTEHWHKHGGKTGWLVEKCSTLRGLAYLVELDDSGVYSWFNEHRIEIIHDK